MSEYRVSFFKNLLSSDGHKFKCLQHQIDVHESEDAARAAEIASRQFEQLHRLRHWRLLADSMEVEAAKRSEQP
jgi:hypothetical protein